MYQISIVNNAGQTFNVETCPDLDTALKAAKTRRTTGNSMVQIIGATSGIKIVWTRASVKDRNHWKRSR